MSIKGLDLVLVPCKFGIDKDGQLLAEQEFGQEYFRRSGSGKTYNYQGLALLGLRKDDIAVVNTPTSGWTLVTVIGEPTILVGDHKDLKWVYAKVDFGVTLEAIKKVKQRAVIMKRLTLMAEEAKRRIDVAEVLKDNPEAIELMKELDALGL